MSDQCDTWHVRHGYDFALETLDQLLEWLPTETVQACLPEELAQLVDVADAWLEDGPSESKQQAFTSSLRALATTIAVGTPRLGDLDRASWRSATRQSSVGHEFINVRESCCHVEPQALRDEFDRILCHGTVSERAEVESTQQALLQAQQHQRTAERHAGVRESLRQAMRARHVFRRDCKTYVGHQRQIFPTVSWMWYFVQTYGILSEFPVEVVTWLLSIMPADAPTDDLDKFPENGDRLWAIFEEAARRLARGAGSCPLHAEGLRLLLEHVMSLGRRERGAGAELVEAEGLLRDVAAALGAGGKTLLAHCCHGALLAAKATEAKEPHLRLSPGTRAFLEMPDLSGAGARGAAKMSL